MIFPRTEHFGRPQRRHLQFTVVTYDKHVAMLLTTLDPGSFALIFPYMSAKCSGSHVLIGIKSCALEWLNCVQYCPFPARMTGEGMR